MSELTRPQHPDRRHATRWRWSFIACGAILAAHCSEDAQPGFIEGPDVARGEQVGDGLRENDCEILDDVRRTWGTTIVSPWHDVSLLDVWYGRSGLAPPNCAYDILRRTRALCTDNYLCSFPGGDRDNCLLSVEQVFLEPIADAGCVSCGDGRCSDGESRTCPQDCSCGDGQCDASLRENVFSCPADCAPACGDGICSGGEQCGACAPVEPVPSGSPEDPVAEPATGEPTCSNCAQDCCRTACGDGVCDPNEGETEEGCPADCAVTSCGDGICFGLETALNCPVDCERLPYDCRTQPRSCAGVAHCLNCSACEDVDAVCGDGVCATCEVWTCASDCESSGFGVCSPDPVNGGMECPDVYCGDGTCDREVESPERCPLDCRRVGE